MVDGWPARSTLIGSYLAEPSRWWPAGERKPVAARRHWPAGAYPPTAPPDTPTSTLSGAAASFSKATMSMETSTLSKAATQHPIYIHRHPFHSTLSTTAPPLHPPDTTLPQAQTAEVVPVPPFLTQTPTIISQEDVRQVPAPSPAPKFAEPEIILQEGVRHVPVPQIQTTETPQTILRTNLIDNLMDENPMGITGTNLMENLLDNNLMENLRDNIMDHRMDNLMEDGLTG